MKNMVPGVTSSRRSGPSLFALEEGRPSDDGEDEQEDQPLINRQRQALEFDEADATPSSVRRSTSGGRRGKGGASSCAAYLKYGLMAVVVLAVVVGVKQLLANPALIKAVVTEAHENPGRVIPLYMLANLVAPLLLLPSGPFQLLAGALWGLPRGLLISGSMSLAANMIAFTVGRHLLQEKLSAYITANVATFPAIQAAILAEGWRLVLMLRLSPVLPDSLMNYALSLTNISFGVFAAATATAMVPWSLLYLYLGSASKDIASTLSGGGSSKSGSSDDGNDDGSSSWVNATIMVVSITSAAAAVLYLGRVIRRAIAKAEAGGVPPRSPAASPLAKGGM